MIPFFCGSGTEKQFRADLYLLLHISTREASKSYVVQLSIQFNSVVQLRSRVLKDVRWVSSAAGVTKRLKMESGGSELLQAEKEDIYERAGFNDIMTSA